MHIEHPLWRKITKLQKKKKNVYFEFSSLLNTKTPKCIQSILHGVTKRHSQKRAN